MGRLEREISLKKNMWHFQFFNWLKFSFGRVHFAEKPTWIGPVFLNLWAIEGFSQQYWENKGNSFLFLAFSQAILPTSDWFQWFLTHIGFCCQWTWGCTYMLHGTVCIGCLCNSTLFIPYWVLHFCTWGMLERFYLIRQKNKDKNKNKTRQNKFGYVAGQKTYMQNAFFLIIIF